MNELEKRIDEAYQEYIYNGSQMLMLKEGKKRKEYEQRAWYYARLYELLSYLEPRNRIKYLNRNTDGGGRVNRELWNYFRFHHKGVKTTEINYIMVWN